MIYYALLHVKHWKFFIQLYYLQQFYNSIFLLMVIYNV